jgi:rhamnose transport system substrate-binding protein
LEGNKMIRITARSRRTSAVLAMTALALVATACSSSKKSTAAASSTPAAPATTSAAAAPSSAAAPASSAAAPASSAAAPASSAAAPASSAAAPASSAAAGVPANIKKGLVVYFIPKDTQNPYEVIADKGGEAALAELGGKVVVSSGTADTAAAQIPSIQAAIQAKADAIVIAGNDPSALCPSLAQAQAAGIKVVSFDSDVTCPNHLFINQANTEQIGTSEVDLLAKEINSTGQIAILSAAATATNQNAWIGYMKQELTKYPNMKLVSTVYGNDDPATSLTVLQGLLSAYPNLAGIISPTTVGISTAAQYLDTHKSLLAHLTLTGLGLPSQMKTYVLDGTVKAFELWNPSNLGYLAGYAAAQAASGTDITTAGATFTAGKLGSYTVLPAASGTGPSVVLGPPTVFDASNVGNFNF